MIHMQSERASVATPKQLYAGSTSAAPATSMPATRTNEAAPKVTGTDTSGAVKHTTTTAAAVLEQISASVDTAQDTEMSDAELDAQFPGWRDDPIRVHGVAPPLNTVEFGVDLSEAFADNRITTEERYKLWDRHPELMGASYAGARAVERITAAAHEAAVVGRLKREMFQAVEGMAFLASRVTPHTRALWEAYDALKTGEAIEKAETMEEKLWIAVDSLSPSGPPAGPPAARRSGSPEEQPISEHRDLMMWWAVWADSGKRSQSGADLPEDGVSGSRTDFDGQQEFGSGPRTLHTSVGSLESIQIAKDAGVPDLIIGDATVLTKVDFEDVLPASGPTGRPAPDPLPTDRPVGRSQAQNLDVQHDIQILEEAGAIDIEFRVTQGQVSVEGRRVGTNFPDLQATLNGRRIHIEYDRAPGTRAMDHAERILSNDPNAIVILKIVDFDRPKKR